MFAGDWRLAVMAYNAGEYRVLGALKRSGQRAMDADPEKLVGLAGITRAYVRKLHALSCVLDRRSEEHTSELQSLMRISYSVFCLTNNKTHQLSLTIEHNIYDY